MDKTVILQTYLLVAIFVQLQTPDKDIWRQPRNQATNKNDESPWNEQEKDKIKYGAAVQEQSTSTTTRVAFNVYNGIYRRI